MCLEASDALRSEAGMFNFHAHAKYASVGGDAAREYRLSRGQSALVIGGLSALAWGALVSLVIVLRLAV